MKTPLIQFRPYQTEVFNDRQTGVVILPWSRQIGKSFVLAAWAVDRLLTRPGRLVVILSNSRDNGQELNMKVAEVCDKLGAAFEQQDFSPDVTYENMNMETRVTVSGKTGRIKVLAASARTARGFSGDLILDEFDWHEDQRGIWEAAEPILSSNPDYLCRIASTLNGKRMMWEMMNSGVYKVIAVRRSDAWKMGLKIYHPVTRAEITPDQARALALDKRAYDQNYENIPGDSNLVLLTHELITAAESETCGVLCEQDWSPAAIAMLWRAKGDLFIGVDVGRRRDLTVITAMERFGREFFARAILRIENMRLPQQQQRLGVVCKLPKFRRAAIDMTGLGLGLVEYSQDAFGAGRILGVDFSTTVPVNKIALAEGRKRETMRITEAMATEMLQVYEDHRIKQPADVQLRDDLRKPEKIVSAAGRVSIAATRDDQGHADHFWSFALALHAAGTNAGPFACAAVSHPPAMAGGSPFAGGFAARRAAHFNRRLIGA
jgi:phage FluMu gp28-like protein